MKTQNNPITESTAVKNNPEVKKNDTPSFWQSVLVGGVPGILIGIGGTMAVEAMADQKAIPEPGVEDTGAGTPEEVAVEIQQAHSVTDDMSFSEAFAAARNEVGPGGAFVWHGQVYGTYRGDDPEWQEMSAEDRAEYSQAVLSQVHPAPYTPTEDEPVIEVVDENSSEVNDSVGMSHDEGDVHIIEEIYQGQTEDGTIQTVGVGSYEGHHAEFWDQDGDGEVDTVLIDVNDNHDLDEGEEITVSGAGITIDAMVTDMQANNAAAVDDALYGDMPDYTNDADTGSFA